MAINSDMQGFPVSGVPLLGDIDNRITLNNLYKQPLRPAGFVLDIVGNNRLLGSLQINGGLSGVGAISATGTVTLSSDTPLNITGANSVLSMTGSNASIGTNLSRVRRGFFKDLTVTERIKIGECESALVCDLTRYVPYTGANANVNLGDYSLRSDYGIAVGTAPRYDYIGSATQYPLLSFGTHSHFAQYTNSSGNIVAVQIFSDKTTTSLNPFSSSDFLWYAEKNVGGLSMYYLGNDVHFSLGGSDRFYINSSNANFYVPVNLTTENYFLTFGPGTAYDNSGFINIGASSFTPTTDLSGVISTYGTACSTAYSVPDPAIWEHKYMIKLFYRGITVKPIWIPGYVEVSASS